MLWSDIFTFSRTLEIAKKITFCPSKKLLLYSESLTIGFTVSSTNSLHPAKFKGQKAAGPEKNPNKEEDDQDTASPEKNPNKEEDDQGTAGPEKNPNKEEDDQGT